MFIVISKTGLPILKEPAVWSNYTPKVGSCDTLLLNTLLIYFECTGKESVSDSESNVSVLNPGNEPIICLRFLLF